MSTLSLLLVATGLAMDALAVSVSYGMSFRHRSHRDAAKISLAFGAFQALMPLVGWLCGRGIERFIEAVDHWVALALLSVVGGKMIHQALAHPKEQTANTRLATDLRTLLALGVATSIDALAIGFSLSLLMIRPIRPVLVIGLVTLVISYAGVVGGYEFKALLGERWRKVIQVAGGLVLVGIGVHIVCEHVGLLGMSVPKSPTVSVHALPSR